MVWTMVEGGKIEASASWAPCPLEVGPLVAVECRGPTGRGREGPGW
jgi:hypothetical protein